MLRYSKLNFNTSLAECNPEVQQSATRFASLWLTDLAAPAPNSANWSSLNQRHLFEQGLALMLALLSMLAAKCLDGVEVVVGGLSVVTV